MSETIMIYVCPQCGWSSRVRYLKKYKVMVCGHCPFEGQPRDFERLVPVDDGTGDYPIKDNSDAPAPEVTS